MTAHITRVATVARSDIHEGTWYPYWTGGAEADMFASCGPLNLVKEVVVRTFGEGRWRREDQDTYYYVVLLEDPVAD